MVTRYYVCNDDSCGYAYQAEQPLQSDPDRVCPACEGSIFQDLMGQHTNVVGEPKILKQLAERNTKRMGKYELEARVEADKQREESKKEARAEALRQLAPPGTTIQNKRTIKNNPFLTEEKKKPKLL